MTDRGEVQLSGRKVNLENVSKVLRTSASDRRETDGREFVVDFLMDYYYLLEASEVHAKVRG